MPMTPVGATRAFLTPAEFLLRKDVRPAQELVLDDETSALPTPADLDTNPVLLALLKQESGTLESAAVTGSRYASADLLALLDSGSNGGELLKGIVADLVAHRLTERRWQASQDTLPGYQYATQFLERLRDGEMALPFVEVAEANVVVSRKYNQDQWDNLGLVSRNTRAFGLRGTFGPYGRS